MSPLEREANREVETDMGPGCHMLLVRRTRPDFKSSAFSDGISIAALKVEKLSVISNRFWCSNNLGSFLRY